MKREIRRSRPTIQSRSGRPSLRVKKNISRREILKVVVKVKKIKGIRVGGAQGGEEGATVLIGGGVGGRGNGQR